MFSEFEINILIWIQENLRCTFLDYVMPYITYLAEYGLLPIIISVVLISIKRTRKCGIVMVLSIAMGFIIVNLGLKPLIARVRPYDAYPLYELLINAQSDFSFPSGHTLVAFECAMSLAMYYKKLALPSLIIASLVGFSRLYLYVHYPTDVLCSVLLGIVFAFVSKLITEKCLQKNHSLSDR